MNVKQSISVIAATMLIAGATTAAADGNKNKNKRQDRPAAAQSRSTAVGVGAVEANRRGATADAAVAAQFEGRRDRNGQAITGNTATTFGSGATYNDRTTASGAISTGGSASGTGVQSTSSDVEAYGTVDRDYTEAQVSGGSTANSGETPRPRRPR